MIPAIFGVSATIAGGKHGIFTRGSLDHKSIRHYSKLGILMCGLRPEIHLFHNGHLSKPVLV